MNASGVRQPRSRAIDRAFLAEHLDCDFGTATKLLQQHLRDTTQTLESRIIAAGRMTEISIMRGEEPPAPIEDAPDRVAQLLRGPSRHRLESAQALRKALAQSDAEAIVSAREAVANETNQRRTPDLLRLLYGFFRGAGEIMLRRLELEADLQEALRDGDDELAAEIREQRDLLREQEQKQLRLGRQRAEIEAMRHLIDGRGSLPQRGRWRASDGESFGQVADRLRERLRARIAETTSSTTRRSFEDFSRWFDREFEIDQESTLQRIGSIPALAGWLRPKAENR